MEKVLEQSNFKVGQSKLPTMVWVNDTGNPLNHSIYYLKVCPKNNTNSENGVELLITDNPYFPKTKPDNTFGLATWEIECIKQWVKDNLLLLRKVCEQTLKLKLLTSQKGYVPPKTKLELRSLKSEQPPVPNPTAAPVMKESYNNVTDFCNDFMAIALYENASQEDCDKMFPKNWSPLNDLKEPWSNIDDYAPCLGKAFADWVVRTNPSYSDMWQAVSKLCMEIWSHGSSSCWKSTVKSVEKHGWEKVLRDRTSIEDRLRKIHNR